MPSASTSREVAGDDVADAVERDERLGRLLRVLVVLERDVAAAGDLADDARAGLDAAQVRRRGRRCGRSSSRSARPSSRSCRARPRTMPLSPPSDEPIGVGHHEVREALEELVLHRRREQRARSTTTNSRRRSRSLLRLVVERLDQRPRHRVAGDHDRVDLLFADQAPHVGGVELGARARPCCRRSSGPSRAHCVAPCISGAIGRNVRATPASPFSTRSSGAGDLVARQRGRCRRRARTNTSSWRQTTPFGMPGRAAGVEDVAVVGRARGRSRARASRSASASS